VLARLLSRTDLELVAAQIIAPDRKLSEEYAALTYKSVESRDKESAELLRNYILSEFVPLNGVPRRIMFLVFRGENPCERLFSVVGKISRADKIRDIKITGETIRDTYADIVYDNDGSLRYFEPAVLTPPCGNLVDEKLRLFAEATRSSSNLVESLQHDDMRGIERTLVIIKPDNWHYPSSKPGNIIDMFSRTGLRIIGCKIYQMSVADALKFYGPVKDTLRDKLAPKIGKLAKEILEKEFKISMKDSADAEAKLAEIAGLPYADDQFAQIVEFMSGSRPEAAAKENIDGRPGIVKSMALVYEGKNAVKRIRDVLGPTDPTKAPGGTIRREFGKDIMVNTAHASDSAENAKREMAITQIEKNNMSDIVLSYIGEKST
jgi:nucleoside diphosphate kinase